MITAVVHSRGGSRKVYGNSLAQITAEAFGLHSRLSPAREFIHGNRREWDVFAVGADDELYLAGQVVVSVPGQN